MGQLHVLLLFAAFAAIVGPRFFPKAAAIVQGQPDSNNSFPMVCALFEQTGQDYVFHCTGTLVSPTTIITAAHCFIAANLTKHEIKAVSCDQDASAAASRTMHAVKSYAVYPGFRTSPSLQDPKRLDDIAIIQLAAEVQGFQPARLPKLEALQEMYQFGRRAK